MNLCRRPLRLVVALVPVSMTAFDAQTWTSRILNRGLQGPVPRFPFSLYPLVGSTTTRTQTTMTAGIRGTVSWWTTGCSTTPSCWDLIHPCFLRPGDCDYQSMHRDLCDGRPSRSHFIWRQKCHCDFNLHPRFPPTSSMGHVQGSCRQLWMFPFCKPRYQQLRCNVLTAKRSHCCWRGAKCNPFLHTRCTRS